MPSGTAFFALADARRKLDFWLDDDDRPDHILHWPIARLPNLLQYAAVEMAAIKPRWKTLRASHLSTARLLAVILPLLQL